MDNCCKALGDCIRQARKEAQLTQAQLAEKLEIDTRTLSNLENYNANPKFTTLCHIIKSLNLNPQQIFYPELNGNQANLTNFNELLSGCSSGETETLFAACKEILSTMRSSYGNNLHT